MHVLEVTCPPGASAGSTIAVQTPNGRSISVQIPPSVAPGTRFRFQVPSSEWDTGSAAAPPVENHNLSDADGLSVLPMGSASIRPAGGPLRGAHLQQQQQQQPAPYFPSRAYGSAQEAAAAAAAVHSQ